MAENEGAGAEGAGGGADGGLPPEVQALIDKAVSDATAGLKRKNHELLGDVRKLRERANSLPDDFDPEEWQKLRADAATRQEEEAKRAGQWDKLKGDLVAKHQQELGTVTKQLDERTRQLHDYVISSNAMAEIAKADGVPELLMPHVKSRLKLSEEHGKFVLGVVDADGNPRIGGSNGEPMTVAELLKEMKESDVFAPAFRGSRATGGGAAGGNRGGGAAVKNPWKRGEGFNLTEQGRILKTDPALAERLKADAGVK